MDRHTIYSILFAVTFIDQGGVKPSTNMTHLLIVIPALTFWVGVYCVRCALLPCNWVKTQEFDRVPDREGAKWEGDAPEASLKLCRSGIWVVSERDVAP